MEYVLLPFGVVVVLLGFIGTAMKLHLPSIVAGACIGCGAHGSAASSTAHPAAPSLAPSSAPALPPTFEVAAVDVYIARQVATQGFVGLSVAIVKDGKIVLHKGYGQSHLRLLGPEAYKILTTPRSLADGRPTSHGCGIDTSVKGGETVLLHDGGCSGFVSYSVLVPRIQSAVVVLSNRDDVAPWDLVNDIVALLNKEHAPPPLKVAGPSAQEVAKDIFAQMQSGRVDRTRLGEDFNFFLTDTKLQGASIRLRALGTPTEVEALGTHERGGMETTTLRFAFRTLELKAVMFRSVDGKVQQFLIYKM